MNFKIIWSILLLLVIALSTHGQHSYQMGFLPKINLNGQLSDDYKVNLKWESRQQFFTESSFKYDYILTDISAIFLKNVGVNNRFGFGYLIRFRDGNVTHRLIQKYLWNRSIGNLQLNNRFAADQSLSSESTTRYRFRYRLSTSLPLSGESINQNEFYLKLSNEYLNSFQKDVDYDLEIRINAHLGYLFADKNKVEFGIDNRFNGFINDDLRSRSWVTLAWYFSM